MYNFFKPSLCPTKKIRIETRMCRRDNKPTRDQKTAQDQQLVFDTAKKKRKEETAEEKDCC